MKIIIGAMQLVGAVFILMAIGAIVATVVYKSPPFVVVILWFAGVFIGGAGFLYEAIWKKGFKEGKKENK